MPTPTSLDLPSTVHAPGLARRFLEQHAAAFPVELVQNALVLVSELVSNAVRHGSAPIELYLFADVELLRVEVHDAGLGVPAPTLPPALDTDIGGRGLLIVAAMSSSWGVTPFATPPGKATWFEITVDRIPV